MIKSDTDSFNEAILSSKKIVSSLQKKIELEYFTEIKLSDFASQHFITPSYLSLLFLQETGQNFTDALIQTRIRKAMEYLEFTELSTERIAELEGFNDRAYFSRLFREKTDYTPSNYRKQKKNTLAGSEKYVYIAPFKNDPLIVSQDLCGLQVFSKEYNVNVTMEAPEEEDFHPNSLIGILQRVIEQKPAGLLTMGGCSAYIPYINKAVDAGIPTILVEVDLTESRHLAVVASDWYKIGQRLAINMARLVGFSGKVAVLALHIMELSNMEDGFAGFKDILSGYPEIEIIGPFNDFSNKSTAAKITEELLSDHPDLAGIAAFDSNGAPGASSVLRKHGLTGKIKVVSNDLDPQHLELMKNGDVQALIGPKRELFTYYGAKLLYDYNHSKIKISLFNDKKMVSNIPVRIDPGLIEITSENLDLYCSSE